MQRIIIIGTTSSGKSTLGRKLSKALGHPFIQIDQLFWKANWHSSSDEELEQKLKLFISQNERWIVDGNYSRTNHLTWPHADTVIWIDLPLWLTLYQCITRSFKRILTREDLWDGTGNRESFKRFFSRESIVLWLLKTYDSNVKRYEERIQSPEFTHLTFHRLRSRREIRRFLAQL